MDAEVRVIESNDIPEWPAWSPSGPLDELQWFTLGIGQVGGLGADNFQVAVATPAGLRARKEKGKFVGLVVELFQPPEVERVIREFVSACHSHTWDGVVERLRQKMHWEYE